MSEENKVPPAKYIFLMAALLITIMAVGNGLAFGAIAPEFLKNWNWINMQEMGSRGERVLFAYSQNGSPIVQIDIGIDLKRPYNETHGVVYWYEDIVLPYRSTLIDALSHLGDAKYVELRIYEKANSSNFETLTDFNVSKYSLDIEYGSIGELRYVKSIEGIATDPATLTQWMIYIWNPEMKPYPGFQYISYSPDKFEMIHLDSVVLIYDVFGGWPADCCSGGAWEYSSVDVGNR